MDTQAAMVSSCTSPGEATRIGQICTDRSLRQFEPSLRMCGESIKMAVLYKKGATT